MRFLIALAAILCSVLPSLANWDERFWPASNSPPRKTDGASPVFQKDIVSLDLALALEERYWAVNKEDTSIEEDVQGSLPRGSVVALEEMKSFTVGLLGNFLDQTRFPIPLDPTSIIVNTSTSSVLQLVYWNATNIATFCGLPSDFFDVTPPRSLAQNGSYGWDGLRKVLTNLVYTYEPRGALINETRTRKATQFEVGTYNEFVSPDGSCFEDGDQTGPIAITSISFSNYVGSVGFFQEASRLIYAVPTPFPPQNSFWFENGFFQEGMLKEEELSGSSGFISAYVGPVNTPLAQKNNIAYTFFRESGDGPLACGYAPPIPISPNSQFFRWQQGDVLTQKTQISEGHYFLYGQRWGLLESCNIWDFLPGYGSRGDLDSGEGDLPCFGVDDFLVPTAPAVFTGGGRQESFREFTHIVRWDFDYK